MPSILLAKQVAWMKRSGIRGFAALVVPYSAMLHTGYVILAALLHNPETAGAIAFCHAA